MFSHLNINVFIGNAGHAEEYPLGIFIQALLYFGAKGAPDHIIDQIAQKPSQDDVFNLRPIKNKVGVIFSHNLIPQFERIEQRATIINNVMG